MIVSVARGRGALGMDIPEPPQPLSGGMGRAEQGRTSLSRSRLPSSTGDARVEIVGGARAAMCGQAVCRRFANGCFAIVVLRRGRLGLIDAAEHDLV